MFEHYMKFILILFVIILLVSSVVVAEKLSIAIEDKEATIKSQQKEIARLKKVNHSFTRYDGNPIDETEVKLLAHLVQAEAGSMAVSDLTRYMVASVVLNRVNSTEFPNTIEEVIYQKGQYACTWNGAIEKDYSQDCYDIAKVVYTHGSIIPSNVVYQANFIQGDVYAVIDGLCFCYE